MRRRSSRVSTPPVGFWGELMIMSLVRGVISVCNFLGVHPEVVLFAQADRHGLAAHEADQ